MTIRVAAIMRQSSSRDDRDPATPLALIEDYCERQGWKIVSKHVERSTSGGKQLAQRPEYVKAIQDVEQGRADRLVAYHRDRFDRIDGSWWRRLITAMNLCPFVVLNEVGVSLARRGSSC